MTDEKVDEAQEGEPRYVVAQIIGGGKGLLIKHFPMTVKGKRRAEQFKKARNGKTGKRHVVKPMLLMLDAVEGESVVDAASEYGGQDVEPTFVKPSDVPFMGSTGAGPNEAAQEDELVERIRAAQRRGDQAEVVRLVNEALAPHMERARRIAENPPRDPFHTGLLDEEETVER